MSPSRFVSQGHLRRGTFEAFGPHLVKIGFRKSLLDELDKPPAEQLFKRHGTIEYFLLPNAMLCYQVDHTELWRLDPIDAHNTRVTTSIFAETGPLTDETRALWCLEHGSNGDLLHASQFP